MSKKKSKKTVKKVAAESIVINAEISEPEAPVAVTRTKRRERVPFGSHKSKLSFSNKDPNYNYRVITDKGGRLSDAQNGGYEFVVDEQTLGENEVGRGSSIDSRVVANVGTNEDGSVQHGYLMRIPKEFYNEDQKVKQEDITAKEESINTKHEGITGGYNAGASIKESDTF